MAKQAFLLSALQNHWIFKNKKERVNYIKAISSFLPPVISLFLTFFQDWEYFIQTYQRNGNSSGL